MAGDLTCNVDVQRLGQGSMRFWKRKSDPWTQRARQLTDRITALEREIQKLEEQLRHGPGCPSPTPTNTEPPNVLPPRAMSVKETPAQPRTANSTAEPGRARTPAENGPPPGQLNNEFGMPRFDLVELWRSCRARFRSPGPDNPELIRLLAAGGAPELRPLRYERRIARNRFLALLTLLILVVLGVILAITRTS